VIRNPSGVEEQQPPMGADLVRWLYMRHNPANNVNFGAGPADDLRNRFVFKLWNTYSFFCTYARLDGFDGTGPLVPLAERPLLDRWILSDLQELVAVARRSFEKFELAPFCLQAEDFVDEKLSNWYVRRNRRRFWKSEQGRDKLAAYQTLHSVLVTLARLFAPITPFLSEVMYQNLVVGVGLAEQESSVHHTDYPLPDEAAIDRELLVEMDALLRVVSLGKCLRSAAQIKVRQPLAELRVRPGDERCRRALERFSPALSEELNVKAVTLHKGAPLFGHRARVNVKVAGPKLGAHMKEVQAALADAGAAAIVALLGGTDASYPVRVASGDTIVLGRDDLLVEPVPPDGWVGGEDRGTQVLLDVRVTSELAAEGLAREVVRHIQELRKTSRLNLEDRIELHLAAQSADLARAVEVHRRYIGAETLAVRFLDAPIDSPLARTVKIDGKPLVIQLRKV
jgi:isoleucyl-tRNA synthetase